MANIKLNLPGAPFSGQTVTFCAPCGCDQVTDGLSINGVIYTVVDAMGNCVTGKGGAWCSGAMVTVSLDVENHRAFLQNASVTSNHGNHVPAPQTANNKKFLRNDNTWQEVTPANIGASPAGHKHTKSEISDFPSSMTPTAHNQAASTITGGTFAGQVNANASAAAAVGTAQVRNIYAGTADMTAGSSPLATGTLYFVYE